MKNFEVKMAAKSADFYIYGDIGSDYDGLTSQEFVGALNRVASYPNLTLNINSQGGNVFEAFAMYTALKRYTGKITANVDGVAASAASFLAMAGHRIRMAANSLMMIHRPVSRIEGFSGDLRSRADMLDQITTSVVETYAKRSGQASDNVMAMMVAETWMGPQEAVDLGFADEITEAARVAAYIDMGRFKKAPARLLAVKGAAIDDYRKALVPFAPLGK